MARVIKIVLTFLLFTNFAFSNEIAGVQIPQNLTNLNLNGAGVRSKLFFDLYVGALYLEEKNQMLKRFLVGIKKWELDSILSLL